MKTNSFKDLTVWQRAMELVSSVYQVADDLPTKENYALGNQLVRAAVSIPSNIAEGYRRNGRKEYLQFCSIAAGSAAELETQLIIAREIYDLDINHAMKLLEEVQKMLYVMIKQLKLKS
jgi:four helix bundle protein